MTKESTLGKNVPLNGVILWILLAAAMLFAALLAIGTHGALPVPAATEMQWTADSSWVKGGWR